MSAETPALTVAGMRKRFGALEVLKGISLTANDGDVISILGSSGSGKSTFLRCINLLETPDEGVVTVAGETIKMRSRRDGQAEPADRRQIGNSRAGSPSRSSAAAGAARARPPPWSPTARAS